MPEEVWLLHHWSPQAPLRAFIFFVATAYTYLTKPAAIATAAAGSGRMSHPKTPHVGASYGTNGGGEALRNRLFFTFAFIEFAAWFWVWVTLKEEVSNYAAKHRKRSNSGSRAL